MISSINVGENRENWCFIVYIHGYVGKTVKNAL